MVCFSFILTRSLLKLYCDCMILYNFACFQVFFITLLSIFSLKIYSTLTFRTTIEPDWNQLKYRAFLHIFNVFLILLLFSICVKTFLIIYHSLWWLLTKQIRCTIKNIYYCYRCSECVIFNICIYFLRK